MKRLLFTMIVLMVCVLGKAQDTIIVSLDLPGSLETTIAQIDENAKYNTASLKVQGPLNGQDMMFIREMCGVLGLNTKTQGVLSVLDLADAEIMPSDEPYMSVYGIDYTSHVNEFGPFFLYNCDNLTELTLPQGISVIDTMAFAGCSNLKELELPGTLHEIGMGAFINCNKIQRLIVPDGVTELGIGAFQRMEALEELTLGNGISEIENSIVVMDNSLRIINLGFRFLTFNPVVFYNTPTLEQLNVDENNPYYVSVDGVLFSSSLDTLVTYPPAYPAEHYVIPEDVHTLAPYSFYNASLLQSVDLAAVNVVDTMAFFQCTALENVTGGEALTTIRFGAFGVIMGEEPALAAFHLPASLSNLDGGAFYGNYMISPDIDSDNPYYTTDENGLLYTKDFTKLCFVPGLTERFSLPETVTTIGEYAFTGTLALPEIYLPDHVTTICDGAFAFALGTEVIVLGNNINKVGTQVIDYCVSLKDLYLFTQDIPDDNLAEYSFLDESGTTMEQCVLHVMPGRTETYLMKKGFYSEEYEMFFFADIAEIDSPDKIRQVVTQQQMKIPAYYGIDGTRRQKLQKGLNIISLPEGNIKLGVR